MSYSCKKSSRTSSFSAEELDMRHDKYERLAKLSRNITIESKRVIFLLHRINGDESCKGILDEVEQKLDLLQNTEWHQIALELQNEDPYQFLRAYSPGLQEYVEALAFFHYIQQHTLLTAQQLKHSLTFSELSGNVYETGIDSTVKGTIFLRPLSVYVPLTEYILGLADLTGEMMRMAINCIGRGELSKPFELCQCIRSIHNAFLSYGSHSREILVKFNVLRQSMRKVEDACYTLKVRGSEIPKHLLADELKSSSYLPFCFETNSDDCLD